MFKKLVNFSFSTLAIMLIAIADMATSTSTFCNHGEPDCPEELLK